MHIPINSTIKIAAICDTGDHVSFFAELIRTLKKTGRIHASLLITGDQNYVLLPDIPCAQIPVMPDGYSNIALNWEEIIRYEESLIANGIDPIYKGRCTAIAQSFACNLASWLSKNPIDCLILWSGVRLISRTAQAVARYLKLPVITLESPYFPFTPDTPLNCPQVHLHYVGLSVLIWDIIQGPQCGPSQISQECSDYEAHPSLPLFLDLWKSRKQSKFSKDDIVRCLKRDAAVNGSEPSLSPAFPKGKRILLVCGQLDKDSSMFFGNHLVRCWRDLVRSIAARLPGNWYMLYKPHPFDSFMEEEIRSYLAKLRALYSNCTAISSTANAHETICRADAVACINSNIGLEATVYAKPVITLGEGHYTKRGFTYDLSKLDDLKSTLINLPEAMSEEQLLRRDRFLSYILFQYLISVGRPERAIERIEKAIVLGARQQPVLSTAYSI
ncbi:MAG: hypothetical protein JXA73_15930 [Acidobacteria bacterium]|nr:hypothetical protein [Acidobacteriota bacterium]